MKKLICLLLTLLMSVGCLCACRDYESDTHSPEQPQQPPRTDEDTEPTQKEETPPPGEFYSLEKAYEKGLITKNDLMNIAYYQNGNKLFEEVENFTPSPKNPETLSEETENAIKETLVYITNQNNSNTKATKNDFKIFKYYGTYNDIVVIMISSIYANHMDVVSYENIDGITFFYGNTNSITLWKSNK